MGAKFEVNISDKAAYSFLAAVLIIVAVVGVYATGIADVNQGSHAAGQISVVINGTTYSLQDILNGFSLQRISNNLSVSSCHWRISDTINKNVPIVSADSLKSFRITGSCICGKGSDEKTLLDSLGTKSGSWEGFLRMRADRQGAQCLGVSTTGNSLTCSKGFSFIYLTC